MKNYKKELLLVCDFHCIIVIVMLFTEKILNNKCYIKEIYGYYGKKEFKRNCV